MLRQSSAMEWARCRVVVECVSMWRANGFVYPPAQPNGTTTVWRLIVFEDALGCKGAGRAWCAAGGENTHAKRRQSLSLNVDDLSSWNDGDGEKVGASHPRRVRGLRVVVSRRGHRGTEVGAGSRGAETPCDWLAALRGRGSCGFVVFPATVSHHLSTTSHISPATNPPTTAGSPRDSSSTVDLTLWIPPDVVRTVAVFQEWPLSNAFHPNRPNLWPHYSKQERSQVCTY